MSPPFQHLYPTCLSLITPQPITLTPNITGEKAKEQKEKSERDSRNQQYAGSSYHVPDPSELLDADDCSGLPWGSISMRHVVARGHESESRRGGAGGSGSHRNNDDDDSYMVMTLPPSGGNDDGSYGGGYYGGGSYSGGSSSTTTYDAYPTITSMRSYSYGSHDSNSAGDFTSYDDSGAHYYTDYDNTRSA
jgi:hypothetical protein